MSPQRWSFRAASLPTTFAVLALGVAVEPASPQSLVGKLAAPPGGLPFNRTVGFEGEVPGNVDGILPYPGIRFAERFAEQTITPFTGSGGELFDLVVGLPTVPLTLRPGAPGQNLAFVDRDGDRGNALGGIGLQGFPLGNGQGSVAVLFDSDQDAVGFEVVGGDGGLGMICAFARDGTPLTMATFPAVDGPKVFPGGPGAGIAGLLLSAVDPGGLSYDNFGFSSPVGLQADMELVETKDSPDPVLVGTELTYTITLRNNGPDLAARPVFQDLFDLASVESVTASHDGRPCLVFARDVRGVPTVAVLCYLFPMKPGDTATIEIKVTPTRVGTLVNDRAAVASDETDPDPSNNLRTGRRAVITSVVNVDTYITAVVIPMVAGLGGSGPDDLNHGQVKALTATLRAAFVAFDDGKYRPARQKIEAFREQIDTVGKDLPEEEREALRQQADLMIDSMIYQGLGNPNPKSRKPF